MAVTTRQVDDFCAELIADWMLWIASRVPGVDAKSIAAALAAALAAAELTHADLVRTAIPCPDIRRVTQ